MIKIKLRKNLLYLLIFFLSYYMRYALKIIMEIKFGVPLDFIYLYSMTLAESFGGLLMLIYQYGSSKRKKETKYFEIEVINEKNKRIGDGILKIYFLIFFAGFFDFYEFILDNYYIYKSENALSPSVERRLSSMQTISSALICTYALEFKMKRHHKISLIIIGICLSLTIISDVLYKSDKLPISQQLFSGFLMFYYMILSSFNDSIEKYLVDTNFINPFKILMFEGIFEDIMAILISIGEEPFKDISKFYKEKLLGEKTLFTLLLLAIFILSMIINVYKVYCNVVYNPMARSLVHYILNPFLLIYYFIKKSDFNKNYFYFIFSEIICIITDFFAFIYNEYLIIYCCDLEKETIDVISERAKFLENKEIIPLCNYEESEISENENDDVINKNVVKKGYNSNVISIGNYNFEI